VAYISNAEVESDKKPKQQNEISSFNNFLLPLEIKGILKA
jgi:hypothetical protein